MRKAVWVTAGLTIVLLIVQIGVVSANPFMFGPHMGVIYPETWQQKTYQTSDVPIENSNRHSKRLFKNCKFYYILDLNFSSNNNPQHALSLSNPQSHIFRSCIY